MRILVTNDDGINSEGLRRLVEFAKEYGEVIVVSPSVEQSAKSHSIEIKKGFEVKKIDLFEGIEAYSVASTPADCVRFAYYGLHDNFDIVFSGVNRGYNLGDDILYSGTVAAAMEGVLVGKKALAFSVSPKTFEGCKNLKIAMNYILNNRLLEKHPIYNVNLPVEAKGIKITRQGWTHFDTYFEFVDGLYYQKGDPHFELEKENKKSDICAIIENEISISPLTIDRTIEL